VVCSRQNLALSYERVERRLTAILAADVAGYSRLMDADEEGTLTQLKAHRRALVDAKIAEHSGRIVKTAGGMQPKASQPYGLSSRRRKLRSASRSPLLSTERVERRLTAILAADVAGYSRLTGLDEEGTHARLQDHLRSLVDPKIAEPVGALSSILAMGCSPSSAAL
jgi:class 3 adenylate cyclase